MARSKVRLESGRGDRKHTVKFMQVLGREIWTQIEREAKARDITEQELLRAVIVPFYFHSPNVRLFDPQNYGDLEQFLKEERKSQRRIGKLIK